MIQNKKPKILIINPHKHNVIGGIETYSRHLIDIFKRNNFDVNECYVFPTPKKSIVNINLLKGKSIWLWTLKEQEKWWLYKFFYIIFSLFTPYKNLQKINLNQYDLIIHNHFYSSFNVNDLKLKSLVQVQHFVKKFYFGYFNLNKQISFILQKFFKISAYKYDLFKKIANVVLFDNANEKDMNLNRFVYKIAIPYMLKIKTIEEIDFTIKNNILYVGRINICQKNISFLNKAFVYFKDPLFIYGCGFYKHFLNKKINYMGMVSYDEVQKVYATAKVFVLTSNFEGFPFVLVEALSNGVPIIVRDTFPSAKFLVNNNQNGVLVNAKASPNEFANVVNEFMKKNLEELKKYSLNALKFANKHLSYKSFEKSWMNILNNVIKQNKNKI